MKKTIAKEGSAGLFRGIGVCLVRSMPVNAGSFMTYENLIKIFEDPKNGF